jgi:nitronate monooxygenase
VVDAFPDTPVVAAGGIADGRGLAAVVMLGAEGALMGTRFYASEESAAHPAAKQKMVEATGDDTARSIVFDISRRNVWPAPYTGRVIRNAHAARWLGREGDLVENLEEESRRYRNAQERGDFEIAGVIAGEAVGLIRDVPSAAEIVDRVVRQAESLLQGR